MIENKGLKLLTQTEIETTFGKFDYVEFPNGRIKPAEKWVAENIVHLVVGEWAIWCHRLVASQFAGVFGEIIAQKLEYQIDLKDGGCYCPRHIRWDIKKLLSSHSWGISLDNRPKDFPFGSTRRQHSMIIEIFRDFGFFYGGDFKTPDPMHYEFCKFVPELMRENVAKMSALRL